ncbi:TetR/AcrR family transcriptional regulator [Gordonia neofelifaecis]|uniref:Tetr family transcriptional regulator n=1 Tax=Gordonia neofelifaecis NRRL B-59395 TaxID=644548 RepID=F1YI49_9ACTN|nr:TetR/AcrR family transcriptional regulator [Gordonia neofelifaecis]EGD55603.1 tetr family transcriptional regulator [Gordonia neofelifaecis NRRL B-59395]
MSQPSGRERILQVAERLVAERGPYGASAREVLRIAQQRNNSAITYHFGSWENLLFTIWDSHSSVVGKRRAEMLETLDPAASDGLQQLVRAYIHPFATEVGTGTPSYWARFNAQLLLSVQTDFQSASLWSQASTLGDDVQDPDEAAYRGTRSLQTVFDLMGAQLTHLEPEARIRRVAIAARFVTMNMAGWERDSESGHAPMLSDFEDELTELTVALLLAP